MGIVSFALRSLCCDGGLIMLPIDGISEEDGIYKNGEFTARDYFNSSVNAFYSSQHQLHTTIINNLYPPCHLPVNTNPIHNTSHHNGRHIHHQIRKRLPPLHPPQLPHSRLPRRNIRHRTKHAQAIRSRNQGQVAPRVHRRTQCRCRKAVGG